MHHAYFVFVGLIFAVIFWLSSHSNRTVSFTDSLFLVESAFTSSGLNTVNISELSTGQQVILALMMILGSPVLISLFTIWFRAHIFEKRFEDIVERERNRKMQATGTVVGMAGAMFGAPVLASFQRAKARSQAGLARRGTWMHTKRAEADAFHLATSRDRDPEIARATRSSVQLSVIHEGQNPRIEVPVNSERPHSAYTQASYPVRRTFSRDDGRPMTSENFDFRAFIRENKKSIGRNGQFFDLTDEEREALGGVEYRALRILFVIVSAYFLLFQIFGAIALGAWLSSHGSTITAVNAQNPWWAGIFLCISSFNNAGMTLLDAGISAFDDDAFVLSLVTVLALAGNYAFPAFLRGTVFLCSLLLKRGTHEDEHIAYKEAFDFILKYPRRLYMMMFPAKANWTFVAICTSIGALNWVMLLVLSIGNSVLEIFPVGRRLGLALFQSLSEFNIVIIQILSHVGTV